MIRHRLALLAVGIVSVAASVSGAQAQAAPAPQSGPVVDEVRFVQHDTYIVRHDILIDTSLTSDPANVANQVAGSAQTAAPSVTCATTPSPGMVTAQYCLNPWSWSSSSMPIPIHYNPTGETAYHQISARGPIMNAITQWSAVTSDFKYTYAGTTNAEPTACNATPVADGVNTIAWVNGITITGVRQGTVLAQTCTIENASDQLVEFDIEINAQGMWSIATPTPAGTYDLYSTVLHEMGHGAGLAHSQYQSAVMWATLASGVEKRALTNDDRAAILAKYGPAPAQLTYREVAPGLARGG